MTSALRKKLLSLAIRGKLVPQDPADEPASVLLERIRAEREAKENESPRRGRGRRFSSDNPPCPKRGTSAGTASAEGEVFEPPFPIPESWAWTTLGTVCDYGKCETVDASTVRDSTWSLDLEDTEKETGRLLVRVRAGERAATGARHAFRAGDLLYSKLRTYLNKVLVADEDGVCSSEILPLDFKGQVLPEYARCVLMSPMFLDYAARCGYGVKMPRLGTTDGCNGPFPLPPLVEQRRIVSRFKALSSLCDSIDEDSAAFDNLARTAKSRILDLAIHGDLVPQNPTDEPASALLDRIRSTADKPPCPKKRKTQKDTIGDVLDAPFPIPESWAWTTLGDVAELVLGGTPDTHDSKCWCGDIPWLTPGEMSAIKGKYVSDTRRKLTQTGLEKGSRMFPSRSVVLSTRAPIGYLFINTIPMCTNKGCKTIVPKCGVLAEYLYYNLLGRVPELQSLGTGTTFKELSSGKLASLPLSLPPLAEQRRIVTKVDELFATIDEMLG